jgi:hypothetical protein
MEPSQDFTSFLLGRPVIVKLNSGVDYRGKEEKRERQTRPQLDHLDTTSG